MQTVRAKDNFSMPNNTSESYMLEETAQCIQQPACKKSLHSTQSAKDFCMEMRMYADNDKHYFRKGF